ncbi:MFS transporter [Umezawaea tangerina]|uniref:Putative MFS transporter n=1 Tax=Umezawaea tangerina TaxID=84725 RepID=A0A2T0T7R4_9PSEU|nr:MFS transporter [Umezawaea tangerina]PRY41692.1 putative MFS transporter [Umezawaea tangerina]
MTELPSAPSADRTTTNPPTGAEVLARLERLPFTRVHLRVATILGVGTLIDSFDGLVVAVALTSILTTFGAPLSVAGLLIAAGYVGQMLGAIGFGILSERYGRKWAYIVASLIFGGLSLLAAFSWSIDSLMAIRLVQGIGLGAEVPVAAAMFNEFVRAGARGRIVTLYESLFVWGILLASLVGGLFLAVFPPETAWRGLFLLGALPLVTAVWAWFRLPESPRYLVEHGRVDEADHVVDEMERVAHRPDGQVPTTVDGNVAAVPPPRGRTRFGELLSRDYRARTALLWSTWLTTYFALWGFTTFMPTLLVKIGGLTPAVASLLTGAITIGDLAVLFVAALTLDRIGRRFWFITGYSLALLGTILGVVSIGLLGARGWPMLFASGAVVLIGVNINAPLIYMYSAELYPTRMRAWATMVGSSLRSLAAVVSPIVLSLLVVKPNGIVIAFVVFGAGLAIGLAIFLRFGIETRQRSLEELAR